MVFYYRVDSDRKGTYSYVAQFGEPVTGKDGMHCTCAAVVSLDDDDDDAFWTTCLLYAEYDVSTATHSISVTRFEGVDAINHEELPLNGDGRLTALFYEFFRDEILVDRYVGSFQRASEATHAGCLQDTPFNVSYHPAATSAGRKRADFASSYRDMVLTWFAPDTELQPWWFSF